MRDLAEETFNYRILMETYLTIGKVLQEEKNYDKAVIAFKMLLLIAW